MTRRDGTLRPAVGVALMFASNGALFASLLPWYPLLVERLELDTATFGLVVSAFIAGAIVSSALPAPLVGRFGPIPVSVGSTLLLAAALAAAGFAGSPWALAACLGAVGFCDAIADVAQNDAAITVQRRRGRQIISSMHAMWSLGCVAGGALATAAAAAGLGIGSYLIVAGGAGAALVITGGAMTLRLTGKARSHEAGDRAADARMPAPSRRAIMAALAPLVCIGLFAVVVEDIANNWAALSAVEVGGSPPAVAGIAYTLMIGSQCLGRFTGDPLIDRLGRARVARFGGICIAAGGLAVLGAEDRPMLLFAGLALAGFGSATLVPSAFSAAAEVPGLRQGTALTLIGWLMRVGAVVASPAIGVFAGIASLRWALGLLVVVGVAVALLARSLDERRYRA